MMTANEARFLAKQTKLLLNATEDPLCAIQGSYQEAG